MALVCCVTHQNAVKVSIIISLIVIAYSLRTVPKTVVDFVNHAEEKDPHESELLAIANDSMLVDGMKAVDFFMNCIALYAAFKGKMTLLVYWISLTPFLVCFNTFMYTYRGAFGKKGFDIHEGVVVAARGIIHVVTVYFVVRLRMLWKGEQMRRSHLATQSLSPEFDSNYV